MATALEISNLSFSYPDGRQALGGVTFSLRAGEKVAILGPNGAGKSTLLLHLNGLLHGNGDVSVMGNRVVEDDKETLGLIRSLVGLVFQDPDDQLFSPTVYDDVAFGPIYMGLPQDEIDDRVLHALSLVGLDGYADRMPFHLSGGEKKRAAIATVLSMNPQVLVLDEPSAGLDPRARRGLITLLDRLDQTILVTTHDLHMVKEILPRSIIMDGGAVVADGPTEEILSDQALLESHGLEMP
ncbi:MAG: ATP-binding cassette domain-containing protein [Dehalococcoidia bacterium]|nr:ATP-binding cassette domain-containing protein [Dehalococcoidia bacterium]